MPPLAVPREKAVRRCVAGSFSGCHDPRKNFFRAGSTFSGAGASNTVKNLIGGISHGIPSLYLPPREAPGTPRRRRPVRRRRRRRGIPSIFRFALLWAMPAVVLFVLHAALPAYLEQASAHGAEDENGTAAEAVPAEEGRIAAVEPVITPALPERAALRSRRTISLRPYQNPPQLRTAILTMQYSLGIPEQRV